MSARAKKVGIPSRSTILYPSTNGLIHFEYEKGAFVTVHAPTLNRGAAIHLVDSELGSASTAFRDLVAETLGWVSGKAELLEVKVVAPAQELNEVRKMVEQSGLTIRRSAMTKMPFVVVYFEAITGKMRLGEFTSRNERQVLSSTSSKESTAASDAKSIRVLMVDDSRASRQVLRRMLETDPVFMIVGEIEHPAKVEAAIREQKPDLITLDINLPDMDGVTLLEKLLPKYQIPTVMVTAVSVEEGQQVFRALELGAIDYIEKPALADLTTKTPLIVERLKTAARVQKKELRRHELPKKRPLLQSTKKWEFTKVIAIGASTGGTEAIRELLWQFPTEIPPVVIVQHIPPVFSAAFASRLDSLLPFSVKEAVTGDFLVPNQVLIAPGATQMKIVRENGRWAISITDDAPVGRHKPSVDYLFESVSQLVGPKAVGILLTGMGRDGATGMLSMRKAGAHTVAQDEESCVVYGMPRAAVEIGAAEEVLPLEKIIERLDRWLA